MRLSKMNNYVPSLGIMTRIPKNSFFLFRPFFTFVLTASYFRAQTLMYEKAQLSPFPP